MRNGLPTMLVALISVAFLGACNYLGEGAKGLVSPLSYSDMKNWKPPSPEELEKLTAECPKPNGIFMNDADVKSVHRLEHYFLVRGFLVPATTYGGREDDDPLSVSSNPIDILGGEKNGIRQYYYKQRTPQERFTLELRPVGQGRFRIGVKSSSGQSGESDKGFINFNADRIVRCENGALKGFWVIDGKILLGWELFVDAASGDIVVHSPGGVFYSPQPSPERYHRFKRIGE